MSGQVDDHRPPQTWLREELNVPPRVPARLRQSYRHEAFFWREPRGFIAATVGFVRDGLEAGEPVIVALIPEHAEWVQDSLGGQVEQVQFVDMADVGRNPARIIPTLLQFLDERSGHHRPARGVAEPIWPGRSAEELVESQLHEALLNVAVDPEIPFWLMCPYDAQTLSPAVVDEAHRSHPVIIDSATYRGSSHYAGRTHADSMFTAELAEVDEPSRAAVFNAHTMDRLYSYLRLELYVSGLAVDQAAGLATAMQLLAASSLRRGATAVTVRIWNQPGVLICEVTDDATVDDVMLGRRPSLNGDDDGFRRVHQLGDLVQVRSSSTGTKVRIHTRK